MYHIAFVEPRATKDELYDKDGAAATFKVSLNARRGGSSIIPLLVMPEPAIVYIQSLSSAIF
jgi:hypothetical protein